MKKVKPLIALLLTTVMLALTFGLAACDSSNGDSGAEVVAEITGELSDVTLDFRWIGDSQPDTARISAAISDYLASIGRPYSIDIHVYEWGEWWDGTVNLALATGETIDLIFMASWAGDVLGQASMGTLRPLNDFLDNFPEIEEILTADFMNASQVGGRNYALPVNKEKARQFGWLLRTDIVEALGMDLDSIRSVDDLEPYLYRAAEEFDMWQMAVGNQLDHQFDIVVDDFALGTEPGSREIFFAPLSDIARANVHRISRWMADGIMNPNMTLEATFASEMLAGRTWAATSQLKPGVAAERMGGLGGIHLTALNMNEPEIANTETTGAMVAIPTASRNPEEAFDFIRLMYTDANLVNMFVFGEEGIDFEYIDQANGIIRLIDSGWDFGSMGWTFGNQFLNYLTEDEDPDKWEQFIAFNESARSLPSLGFVADRTDTDLETWLANVTATMERFEDLIRGFVPPDQVDATFDRLYNEVVAAGKYEILEELQRQFDEWLETR